MSPIEASTPRDEVPAPKRFDRFSLGMYGALLVWDWLLYAFGPVIQILGGELHFDAAQIGLHGTALAIGTGAAGGVLPPLVRTFGRRGTLVLGAALLTAGGAGLTVLTTLPATLTATLVLALGGNIAAAAAQAGLVVHHPMRPADAVATANGLGTVAGFMAPIALGAAVAAGLGWRPVVLLTVPFAVVAIVVWLRMPASPAMTPRGRPGRSAAARRKNSQSLLRRVLHQLPAAGWWFLLAALLGVAIENAITFWSLTLVLERTDADTAVAAAATAAFVGGMASSRLVSWWFTARTSPSRVVLWAFGVNVLGWFVLWSATVPWTAVLGLGIAGAGCGLLYPLAASLMLSTARGSKDTAQGLIMIAIGVAVGVVPFVLGVLADAAGVHTAFLLIPALAVLGAAATVLGARRLPSVAATLAAERVLRP